MDKTTQTLMQDIQDHLTQDLLMPEYRGHSNPLFGHCYVASEVLYHCRGRVDTIYFIRHEENPHWFLKTREGEILDVTAGQFETPVPYENAIKKGFLTGEPSQRARTLMDSMYYRYLPQMEVRVLSNPKHDPHASCVCGHEYERHFDSYYFIYEEEDELFGCKYCNCSEFREERREPSKNT